MISDKKTTLDLPRVHYSAVTHFGICYEENVVLGCTVSRSCLDFVYETNHLVHFLRRAHLHTLERPLLKEAVTLLYFILPSGES